MARAFNEWAAYGASYYEVFFPLYGCLMFGSIIRKLLIFIILQPFALVIIFFAVPPGFNYNFDYFLKGRSDVVVDIERKFMRSIVLKREFSTKELFRNSEFEQYCVIGPEIHPVSDLPKKISIFHNMGGWGWDDNAWHINFIGKGYAVVFQVPTYIPLEKVARFCRKDLIIRFSKDGHFVVEESE